MVRAMTAIRQRGAGESLRDRLIALADEHSIVQTRAGNRAFAIAAARMALDEAAQLCDRAAARMFAVATEEGANNDWSESEAARTIGAHEQRLAEILRDLAAALDEGA